MPSFPKPERRATTKRRKGRIQAAYIQAVRVEVFARDSTCRICLGSRSMSRHQDAMHESPSRAQTRNLPLEQRFSTKICGRLCRPCHRDVGGNIGGIKIRIVFLDPALGFDGPVRGEPIP